VELIGDWKKAAKKFANLDREMRAAVARAGARLGPEVAQAIRVEMGGSFPRLHPFTAEAKGSDRPLVGGELEQALTFRVTPRGNALVVWAGIAPGPLGRVARVQEYGCTIAVTDRMRAYLHAEGLHLSAATEYIAIPPRPFVRPGLRRARGLVRAALKRELRPVLRW